MEHWSCDRSFFPFFQTVSQRHSLGKDNHPALLNFRISMWTVDPVSWLISFSRLLAQIFSSGIPQPLSFSQKCKLHVIFDFFPLDWTLSLMQVHVTRERSARRLVIWSLGVLYLPTRSAMEHNFFSMARKEGSCRIFLVAALTIHPRNYLAEA